MRCLGCWRRRRRKCSASADGQGAASPAAAGCGLPARRGPALVSRGSTAMLPPAAAQQRLGGRSLPGVKQSWWRVASAPGVCVCVKRGSSHKTKCPPSHGPACVQGQMAARRLCFNMVRLWLHGGTLAAAGEDRRGQAGPLVASTAAVGAACVGCRRSAWCPRWRGHHGGGAIVPGARGCSLVGKPGSRGQETVAIISRPGVAWLP